MKNILISNIVFFTLLFIPGLSHANTLINAKFNWHSIEFIEYSVWSPDFNIQIWVDQKWWSQVLEIAQNIWAITGINGVFECPKDYTECGWKNFTINERYVQWEKINTYDSTGARVVFGWDKNTLPMLFQTDTINKDSEDEIWEWFANFPLLLKDWEDQIERYVDLGLVDKKMTWPGRRSFICSTQERDKIYFGHVYHIWVDWMSLLLKDFWCYNALNLDAGYSTAFIYNWKYIAWPWRYILDGVFIVPKNFDTKNLEIRLENIVIALEQYFDTKTSYRKLKAKSTLQSWLDDLAEKIYAKHSQDYLKDWIIIWEQTNITSRSTLKKLYLINRLRDELKKL